jgi:hypothetical protein
MGHLDPLIPLFLAARISGGGALFVCAAVLFNRSPQHFAVRFPFGRIMPQPGCLQRNEEAIKIGGFWQFAILFWQFKRQ